jgi:hypothetical protein
MIEEENTSTFFILLDRLSIDLHDEVFIQETWET